MATGNWQLVGEFTEVERGKHSDRPQLAAALAACKKHRAKLVIAKLDRLSRNLAFIAAQMDSGVEFVAVDTHLCADGSRRKGRPKLRFQNDSGLPQGPAGASGASSACGKLAQRVPGRSPCST
jgi:DNA invertase Pin-like site-specific DNA recombinase